MHSHPFTLAVLSLICTSNVLRAEEMIEPRLVHLRSGTEREWSEFPDAAESVDLHVEFESRKNDTEWSLRLQQQDVKQGWNVLLNGKRLGDLVRDENDMVLCFAIPPETLKEGKNVLSVEPQPRKGAASDDIRVGRIRIAPVSREMSLNEGTVEIEVVHAETNEHLPCRITIVDREGVLQTVGATSTDQMAVRAGTIFTAAGQVRFGLPAGTYTVYAGRGFEYSLARSEISVDPGKSVRQTLKLTREVPTTGYVACDTHVHTLTHSGHGDATIAERMLTIAGEGIELPIATDHNIHINYEPIARQLNVRKYFTPVPGNEVTTSVGHFNAFPIATNARVPDHRKKDWESIFTEVFQTEGVRAVILNHARDLHSGVRPFGPQLFIDVAGASLKDRPMRFNAMEVFNSGAVQTDQMQLFQDWMAVLNRGYSVTPVGASDSHDVARHFVGQARTYIRVEDIDPAAIDINAAINSFLQGKVMVSYGLLAELTIGGQYRSGDLVPRTAVTSDGSISVDLRVLGPHWTHADRIRLYANGKLVRDETLPVKRDASLPVGVHWQATWKLPCPQHDVYLVAIASGPGVTESYWKTAKPYQPTSPDFESQLMGCSGALWIDGDADGRRSSARDYAEKIVEECNRKPAEIFLKLRSFDSATAIQVAHYLSTTGTESSKQEFEDSAKMALPATKEAFEAYFQARKKSLAVDSQP